MIDDVILNKTAIIERCIGRIKDEYANDPRNLQIITKQDSIILNIQRACEAAIDLAMHLVRWYRLGIPQESRGAFQLLVNAGRLPPSLGETMTRMVGFRNIAVHDYRKLDLRIVQAIIENKLEDLLAFASHAIKSES